MSSTQVTVTARTKLGLLLGQLQGTPCPSPAGFLGTAFAPGSIFDQVRTVTLATNDVAEVLITVEGSDDSRSLEVVGELSMVSTSGGSVVEAWLLSFSQTFLGPLSVVSAAAPVPLTVASGDVSGDLSLLSSGLGVVSAGGLVYAAQLTALALELP